MWIVRAKFCSAVEGDMIPAFTRDPVDEVDAKWVVGFDKWRAI